VTYKHETMCCRVIADRNVLKHAHAHAKYIVSIWLKADKEQAPLETPQICTSMYISCTNKGTGQIPSALGKFKHTFAGL